MSSPTAEDGRTARRRRLSAIVQADLSGYVRLMEGGEDRTVSRLKSVRAEIWLPAVDAAGGRIVNIVGDSVLAEFSSAVAAVAAAIDIQERMARFNDALDEEQRLMFRIGLHLGEVIVDETETIFGDAVNVAARIQLMAEPGGIAASRRDSRRHASAGGLHLRRWRQASRQACPPFSANLSCPQARKRVRCPRRANGERASRSADRCCGEPSRPPRCCLPAADIWPLRQIRRRRSARRRSPCRPSSSNRRWPSGAGPTPWRRRSASWRRKRDSAPMRKPRPSGGPMSSSRMRDKRARKPNESWPN